MLTHADGSRFGGFFVDGVLHGRGAACKYAEAFVCRVGGEVDEHIQPVCFHALAYFLIGQRSDRVARTI